MISRTQKLDRRHPQRFKIETQLKAKQRKTFQPRGTSVCCVDKTESSRKSNYLELRRTKNENPIKKLPIKEHFASIFRHAIIVRISYGRGAVANRYKYFEKNQSIVHLQQKTITSKIWKTE